MRIAPLLLAGMMPIVCGCEPPASSTARDSAKGTATVVHAARGPTFVPPPDPNAPVKPVAPTPTRIREVARAGITDKGKYDPGIMTTPLTANFSIREQLVFDAQIPKAMEIFVGLRNRKPASHQEFMREIIAKSNIRLPPLPPNYGYIYDPESGELMVERPATGD